MSQNKKSLTDPTQEIAQNTEIREKPGYLNFVDNAEKVPYELQNKIADYKRQVARHKEPDNLLDGMIEETGNWSYGKRNLLMAKMRLKIGPAIYIPLSEIGAQYRHIDVLVGKSMKVAVTDFLATDTFDKDGHAEYVAIGSIREAEYIIGHQLMQEYQESQEKDGHFTTQQRTGIITDVIDTDKLQMIFFQYRGMSLGMYENDFTYRTYTIPLHTIAHIGDTIHFQIRSIRETTYEDLDTVKKQNQNSTNNLPKGKRYFIRTTCLPYRQNPNTKVKRLEKSGGAFIAHITRYDPIKGILVEIAPGWEIKAKLSVDAPYKPSLLDEMAHTPVTVRILHVKYETRRGVCQILSFPQGVARTRDQTF